MATEREALTELRMLVGYLGELEGWWGSQFYGATSKAFLSPIFGRSTHQARLQGVTAAAGRVHDERIGVGRTLHLFRMPELLEQTTAEVISDPDRAEALSTPLASKHEATTRLAALAGAVEPLEGPVLLGEVSGDLSPTLAAMAGHYLAAFQGGTQTYPYLRDLG